MNPADRPWHESIRDVLKDNNVRLVTYVPDNVLNPLIKALHADPFFTTFCCTREEEAVGIATGAWMGGMLGVVLMQTSGFATLPNVLASLAVPYQIPLLMIISERGTLGEFNLGQAMVCRTMRPALDSMGIEHHTIRRPDEVEFVVGRTISQAVSTQAPAALILNPFLTGGKVEKKEK
ncbi:thiamine pyrophosphate-binding protein [Sinorhizobium mexicanum]|uniref:Decarboxylase n=1 Tax=Sinorhizobium mexicanum TaxID=375549 RepID=A0A859QIY3_9HYPH|nr:thiamine pyrophosphate-binding protein [Sinorhizobium mexicanum]MBP1883784.1 sulfopyruvate decarboxylase alpha subunit [Sinorhizobium mexicanum]QLL62955.1 decarboxylase [Sinorhizobium mexicanum]